MRFIYFLVNIALILLFGILIYEKILLNELKPKFVIVIIFLLLVINISLFVFQQLMERLFNYLIKKYEEKKMKNYSLFEWMGEHTWIELYDALSKIKDFNRKDIIKNFNVIKKEIKSKFDNNEKLTALRIFLEVRVESPRLTTLTAVMNTILISIITSSLVSYLNGILSLEVKGTFYIITFVVVFFILLVTLNFLSKESDKYKLLLKLVNECIKDENK